MRRFFALAALAAALAAAPADAVQSGYGQVMFQNNTNVTGHLYVDGNYGCGPVLMNLNCVTTVSAGTHSSYVKFDDGDSVSFQPYDVASGQTVTLTVNLQSSN